MRIHVDTAWKRGVSLLLLTLLLGTACHTMRFRVDEGRTSKVVHHRKSFFLWGLTPTRTVDVSTYCPHGALAVREETTFVDGLLNSITLGIWTPRSSWYHCKAEEDSP